MTDPNSHGLAQLRVAVVSRAGGVFRNAIRQPLITCAVCATPVDGWERCFPCAQHHARHGDQLADAVGVVTYAVERAQSGYVMRGYKAQPRCVEEHRTTLRMITALAVHVHTPCVGSSVGTPATHWATVPTLPRSSLPHPITELVSPFAHGLEVPLVAASSVSNPRGLDGSHFSAKSRDLPAGAHVLLVDDTWTGGGHAQSAVLALRTAGAAYVSVLILGRWLKPSFASNAVFIRERLTADFDPMICPWTGASCP